MEGIRLAGTFGSYREASAEDTIREDDGREVPIKPKDRVFVSFVSSHLNPPALVQNVKPLPFRPELIIHYHRSLLRAIQSSSPIRRLSTRAGLWTGTSTMGPARMLASAVRPVKWP